MLYHLLYSLREYVSGFNVFRYLTFRSMSAFFLTLFLVLILQPRFIRWFRERQLGQPIRDDGPQTHLGKKGTPTMGGLVIVVAVAAATLLLADLTNLYVWITLLLMGIYAGVGFADDYLKVIRHDPKGISARTKLGWQFGGATLCVGLLMLFSTIGVIPEFSTELSVPFLKEPILDLGFFYLPFAVLVIVGASNAVNLTDGLDGLVIGPVMTSALAYGIFSYASGNANIAEYLQIPFVRGSGELSILAAAVIAGGLGFLWYNSFPAQVFMGDVGALALGGVLGILSIITKQELILALAGGVFVLEALSVILQVASFKMTGRRIFQMAPLHHHYELKGLSEPKIIVRAWIISIVLAILSLATLKLR